MKNILTVALLLVLFSGMAFAEGQVEEQYYTDANSQVQTFKGVLQLDNGYPILATSDGKMYYLQISSPINRQDMPKVGDKLEVQAYRDFGNPNVIFVESAKVNGKEIQFSSNNWYGPGYMGGGHMGDWGNGGGHMGGGHMGDWGNGGWGNPGNRNRRW